MKSSADSEDPYANAQYFRTGSEVEKIVEKKKKTIADTTARIVHAKHGEVIIVEEDTAPEPSLSEMGEPLIPTTAIEPVDETVSADETENSGDIEDIGRESIEEFICPSCRRKM
jgi:hypothetical protein